MAVCRIDPGESYFISLNHAFINDPDIDEVDVIPCLQCQEEQKTDGDPIVVVHHKLGIKSWCVKHLYLFAYKKLLKGKKDFPLTVTDSIQLTRAVLMFNAECCTAWNNRKELTSRGLLSFDDDLKFSSLVISKYPRSSETFAHSCFNFKPVVERSCQNIKRWTITQLLRHKGEEFFRQGLLRTELVTTLHAAECYADNYTAWSHRGWLVERFMSNRRKKLFCELKMMGKWTEMHISDNCGFHYRQVLIKLLQNICSRSEIVQLLLEELEFTEDLILMFPGHEVIWYHRRFLYYYWNQWFADLSTVNLLELAHSRNSGKESSNSLTDGVKIDFSRTNQSRSPPLVKQPTGRSHQLFKIPNSTPVALELDSNSLTVDQGKDKLLPLSTTSELTFCDVVIAECSDHEKEVQQRCASNYERWIKLSFKANNSKITVTCKADCSS